MATFPGCLIPPSDQYQDPLYIPSSNRENWGPKQGIEGSLSDSPLASCQPINYVGPTPISVALFSGCDIPIFTEDFYDRIHLVPPFAELGQVLSDRSVQLEVWNAYRQTRTLTAISPENSIGITFDSNPPGSVPPPDVTFTQLQSYLYDFDISIAGPPAVNASFHYVFDSETVTYRITGQRLTIFPFKANWSQPVVERLEWKTNTLKSFNDKEQLIALRGNPRRAQRAGVGGIRLSKQILTAAISQNQPLPFAVPSWHDQSALTEDAPLGSSVVMVDTTTRSFLVDGFAVIMKSAQENEIIEIISVSSDSLTLKTPTEVAWDQGTEIYPLRIMRLQNSQALQLITGNVDLANILWEQVDPEVIPPEAAPVQVYNGYPVLTLMPNWAGDRQRTFSMKMGVFDSQTGYKVWDQQGEEGRVSDSFSWYLNGRDKVEEFKSWLAARRGKQGAFWLPSWGADLTMVDSLTPSSVNMVIAGSWGSLFYREDPNVEHHIKITTKLGQVFYRQVLSITESETPFQNILSFSNPDGEDGLGIALDPQDMDMISFMRLCRLQSDVVEVTWQTLAFATCDLRLVKGDHPS